MKKIRILLILALLIAIGMLPANTQANNRWQATITDSQLAISFRILGKAGDTLNVSVERVSGDLIPYLVFYNRDAAQFITRMGVETSEEPIDYTYRFTQTAIFDLIVTREDVETGTTQGEFVISLSGADLNGVYTVDQNLEEIGSLVAHPVVPALYILPAETAPATVVFSQRTFEGEISNEHLRDDYLIFLKAGQSLTVAMEQIGGNLLPNPVLYDMDEKVFAARGTNANPSILSYSAEIEGWYRLISTRFDFTDGLTEGRYRLIITIGPST